MTDRGDPRQKRREANRDRQHSLVGKAGQSDGTSSTTSSRMAAPAASGSAALVDEDFPVLTRDSEIAEGMQTKKKDEALLKSAGRSRRVWQPLSIPAPARLQTERGAHYAQQHSSAGGDTRADAGCDLDALAAECIWQLHRDGKHVSVYDVEQQMCRRLGCDRLPLDGKPITASVPRVQQLHRDLSRIQVYVDAYLLNPVCTVYDLGRHLAASMSYGSKKSFDDLGLGPLTKVPVVYDRFKCPSTVVEISPADVISCMRRHLDKTNRDDSNSRLTAERFILMLAEDYGCSEDDVYRLGVRIRSIPLLIQEVARARREANAALREARERQKSELLNELVEQMTKLKRYFAEALDRRTDRGLSIRRKYMHMSPLDVLKDAWQRCSDYVTTSRVKENVVRLLSELSKDPTASQIFQLALCSAHSTEPAESEGINGLNEQSPANSTSGRNSQTQLSAGAAAAAGASQPRPTLSRKDIIEAIKRSVTRRKVEFLRIEDLKAVEEDLRRTLKVKDFCECGFGSFIAFLCSCTKELEDAGLNLVLSADGGDRLRNRRTLAVAFIRHYCNLIGSSTQITLAEQDELLRRLRIQFGITHLHELGVASLQSLMISAGIATDRSGGCSVDCGTTRSGHSGEGSDDQRKRKATITHTSMLALQDQPVLYEVACVRGESGDGAADLETHIALPQTEHSALQCILNTPLLEDINSWTQWSLVFYEKFGDITKFIMENYKKVSKTDFGAQACHGLRALLTKDGRLLRIPASGCNVDAFGLCVAAADARGAAACLAALACTKGTAALPLQLLSSHVQKKLAEMASRDSADNRLKRADGYMPYQSLLDFVLTALILLPLQIAQHAARQVFIAPLAAVMGSQTKAENELFTLSKRRCQDAILEQLGLFLGIRGWAESFDRKLEPTDTTSEAKYASNSYFEEVPDMTILNEEKHKSQGENEKKLDTHAKTDDSVYSPGGNTRDSPDSTATPALKTNDDACRAVINDIRKKYDFDSTHKESEASLNLKKQLGNSLERLSRELYNSNTHFVLELIQNADDNRYGCDVSPALLFVIADSAIEIYNNEEGFSENDIRAISAIGQSTKGKHKQGYIGQKGIGFKSVFTVTDAPEVHSNGYHICFDLNQGPMGYILPSWVQGKPPTPPEQHVTTGIRWNTTIVLPLKQDSDKDYASAQSLTNSFHDLKPILLLFLHRLRQISYIMKAEKNKVTHIKRKDITEHLLRLECGQDSDLWLVSRMRLDTAEELQVDVESTELSLAFPVFQEKKHYEPYLTKPDKKPKKQQTFAYLPLRDFGFKFVLQADFEIPSSRQDVRHDSKWNEWIREAVPQAFMHSRKLFLELQNLDSVEASIYFLKFLPLPGEVTGFFEPVVQGVLERLSQTAVIPIQLMEKAGVEWKLPSEVIICPKEVQNLIPASLLTEKLHLYYAIPQFVKGLGEELLINMGVKKLDSSTIVELLQILYDEYDAKNQNFPLQDCAKWLSIVYHFMNDGNRQETLSRIASLKIFWLSDNSVVKLNKNKAVFMPEDAENSCDNHALRLLKSDLFLISEELLTCQSELANAQVKEVLDLLGVRAPTSSEIINDYIIPTLRSAAWQEKSNNILVAYVQVLFIDWIENKTAEWLVHTTPCLRLLTSTGERACPAERDVYLTPVYFNSVDLKKSYPAYNWCLISDEYISRGVSDQDRQNWKEFLVLHGLKELFEVELQKSSRSRENLENTMWHNYLGIVPHDITGELEIEDYDCCVLRELLDSKDPTSLTSVYNELLCNWDTKYSSMEIARIHAPHRKQPYELPSTFALTLCTRDWMPCTPMTGCSIGELRFRRPSTIWLAEPKLQDLLAHTVEYALKTKVAPSKKFCDAVKLNYVLTAESLLEFLKYWSKPIRATAAVSVAMVSGLTPGVPFVTSVSHMSRVYHYLWQFAPQVSRDSFQNEALVFIPSQVDSRPQSGNFLPLKVLRWSDPTNLFDKYKPDFFDEHTGEKLSCVFIEQHYDELKNFFVGFLMIEEEPSLKQYCLLLQHISQSEPRSTKESIKDATAIYSALGRKCKNNSSSGFLTNQQYASSLRGFTRDMPILATSAGNWVHLTERLLLDDDPELGDLFRQDNVNVAFLAVDISDDVLLFCAALKIEKLSEKVERISIVDGLRPSPLAHQYVNSLLPWVQRFLLSKTSMKRLYNDLSCFGKDSVEFPESRLRNIFQVKSLELVVRLKGWDDCTVKRAKKCEYVDSDRSIYLQYSIVEDDHCHKMHSYIHEALASVLRTNEAAYSEFKDSIDGFMSQAKSFLVDGFPDDEKFVKKHRLQLLPDGVRPWALPQLEVQTVPPERMPHNLPYGEQQADTHVDLIDTPAASKITSGLTCWPPRQYECSQAEGLQKGSTSTRQLLPEFAKKVPPPPTDEISANQTTESEVVNPGNVPTRQVLRDDGGLDEIYTVTTRQEKQHQTTSASAVSKDYHESKHKRAIDMEEAGKADNAGISATHEKTVVNAEREDTEKCIKKQVQATGDSERSYHTRDQLGILQRMDFSKLDRIPELVPVETDIGALLSSLSPELFMHHEGAADRAVGYRGELCAYHYLCKKHELAIREGGLAIEWVNCKGETGSPYDIVVRDLIKKRTRYIEVKSTRTESKCCFELSMNEVKFALENTGSYSLYRIYNAGSHAVAEVKLRILNDLANMISTKKVGLYIII